jgi:hypothetical protein
VLFLFLLLHLEHSDKYVYMHSISNIVGGKNLRQAKVEQQSHTVSILKHRIQKHEQSTITKETKLSQLTQEKNEIVGELERLGVDEHILKVAFDKACNNESHVVTTSVAYDILQRIYEEKHSNSKFPAKRAEVDAYFSLLIDGVDGKGQGADPLARQLGVGDGGATGSLLSVGFGQLLMAYVSVTALFDDRYGEEAASEARQTRAQAEGKHN